MARSKRTEDVAPDAEPTTGKAGKGRKRTKGAKKTRWYHQVWQAYQMTRRSDPSVTWWMLLIVVGVIGVALALGFAAGQPVYAGIIGIPFAILGAMFLLARRAERAAYKQIEGQPGAARAALGTIRRGWDFPEEPVAIDPRTQDMIFRGVGRAGVVLVSEAPPGRANRLLEAERKKVARVLPTVPVHLLQAGDGEGQVPLIKLARKVQKLKRTLNRYETAEVTKRLTALGGMRMPVPKGVDPLRARPDRKALRGR